MFGVMPSAAWTPSSSSFAWPVAVVGSMGVKRGIAAPFGRVSMRCRAGGSARAERRLSAALLPVVPVQVVGGRVLHDARDLGDEFLVVAGPPQQVEAQLHAG